MADIEDERIPPNTRSESTKWAWKLVRVNDGVAPAGDSPGGSALGRSRGTRARRARHTVVLSWRGGPEASWWAELDGRGWRVPGHMCLEDLMALLLGEVQPWKR